MIGPEPACNAADSRVRTTVVPTATMRRSAMRARFRASAASGGMPVAFAVKMHVVYALHSQGSERAQSDVQRYTGNFDSACRDRVQHLRSEVQSGGWSSNGAALSREDRLVSFAIIGSVFAMDVGRKRHVADAFEDGEEIIDRREFEQPVAELAALKHFGFEHDRPSGAGNTSRSPMATFRPGRTSACQRFSPAGSVSMTSMRPVGFSFSRRSVRLA